MIRCKCGNAYFSAVQECTLDVIVDTSGDVIDECGVNVYESADGPYTCTECETEYSSLDDLPEFPEGAFPDNEYNPSYDRLFVVCVSDDNSRDTQIYVGHADNPEKTWDDAAWQDCKRAEVFLGIISASSREMAIDAMAAREKLPTHVLTAYVVSL